MALLPYTTRVTTQRKVKSSDNAPAAESAEVEVPVLDDVDTPDVADMAEVDA